MKNNPRSFLLFIIISIYYLFSPIQYIFANDLFLKTLNELQNILPNDGETFIENDNFKAVSYKSIRKIDIIILKTPIKKNKIEAENKLVEFFKTDPQNLCIFDIQIYTLYSVDQSEIGNIYKPDFCKTPNILQKSIEQTTDQNTSHFLKASDLNSDNKINSLDYALYVQDYRSSNETVMSIAAEEKEYRGDINKDGKINALDASILIDNFGEDVL